MLRLIIFTGLIFIINACSLGGGPAPQDHFYKLPEIRLDTQQPIFNELVIKPVQASGLYHERAILFVESDRPLELQRYHYRFWSTTPSELIHSALYQGLQSSNIARHIVRNTTSVQPDYIIDSRIIHFERLIENKQVSIEVALEISVRSGEGRVLWTRRYHVNKKLMTQDMHSSAEAFGAALKEISAQLVADLFVQASA